jgi:hypothetical protein
MHSCIYQGRVSHRRFEPVRHDFRYSIYMLYVDLAELPELFDRFWLWSARSPAPAWFRRADHYGDASTPLDESIRTLVASEAGFRPAGPIRLLTHFRYFGHCFNPLSAYYCFGTGGELEAVVLEVSNMPWREMHPYVLTRGSPIANGGFKFDFAKTFHVSPFLPMDMGYRCRLAPPGERLALALENWREGKRSFDAHLSFERVPISARSLARVLATDPLATLRVTALIHWQALRLWRKRAPVYDHSPKAMGEAR